MRNVVEEMALPSDRPARFAEPAAAEFANLYAAINETLRNFDAQIRAAEHELEVLRVLRGIHAPPGGAPSGEALNDNHFWAEHG
jgi:hypothetical protein